jgi:hypothetical protein
MARSGRAHGSAQRMVRCNWQGEAMTLAAIIIEGTKLKELIQPDLCIE